MWYKNERRIFYTVANNIDRSRHVYVWIFDLEIRTRSTRDEDDDGLIDSYFKRNTEARDYYEFINQELGEISECIHISDFGSTNAYCWWEI